MLTDEQKRLYSLVIRELELKHYSSIRKKEISENYPDFSHFWNDERRLILEFIFKGLDEVLTAEDAETANKKLNDAREQLILVEGNVYKDTSNECNNTFEHWEEFSRQIHEAVQAVTDDEIGEAVRVHNALNAVDGVPGDSETTEADIHGDADFLSACLEMYTRLAEEKKATNVLKAIQREIENRIETFRKNYVPETSSDEPISLQGVNSSFVWALDPINRNVWHSPGTPDESDPNSRKYEVENSDHNRTERSFLTMFLSSDAVKLNYADKPFELTEEQRRVYSAIESLWEQANTFMKDSQTWTRNKRVVTFRQILQQMGEDRNPTPKEIQKIQDMVDSFTHVKVFIDISREYTNRQNEKITEFFQAYPPFLNAYPYRHGEKKGEEETQVDKGIVITDEQPLFTFARLHYKEITSFSPKFLKTSVHKSPLSVRIDNFLHSEIQRILEPDGTSNRIPRDNRIRYRFIFEKCEVNIKNSLQKARAKEYIHRFLLDYVNSGFIYSFSLPPRLKRNNQSDADPYENYRNQAEKRDGFTIVLSPEQLAKKEQRLQKSQKSKRSK